VLTILPGALVIYFVRNYIAKALPWAAFNKRKNRKDTLWTGWLWDLAHRRFLGIIAVTLMHLLRSLAIKFRSAARRYTGW